MQIFRNTRFIGSLAVVAVLAGIGFTHNEPSPFRGSADGTFNLETRNFVAGFYDEAGQLRYKSQGTIFPGKGDQGSFRGPLFEETALGSIFVGYLGGKYTETSATAATLRAFVIDGNEVIGTFGGDMQADGFRDRVAKIVLEKIVSAGLVVIVDAFVGRVVGQVVQ